MTGYELSWFDNDGRAPSSYGQAKRLSVSEVWKHWSIRLTHAEHEITVDENSLLIV